MPATSFVPSATPLPVACGNGEGPPCPACAGATGPDAAALAEDATLSALLARVAAGDAAAMEGLYRQTAPRLNALLLRLLRDTAAAEELLQETYLAVWRRAVAYDPQRGGPMAWLVTIARNRALDRLRARRAPALTTDGPEGLELPDPGPSALDRLAEAQRRHRLAACLEGLEERQRAAIRAAFFDGLTYDALAARAGVPPGTMRSWIRRGLLRLRACLDG